MLRADGKRIKCPAHRLVRGPKDIPRVDLKVVARRRGPVDSEASGQGRVESIPLTGAQLFGVVQTRKRKIRRKDHTGSYDRTRKRTPASLVNPTHGRDPAGDKLVFLLQGAGHVMPSGQTFP